MHGRRFCSAISCGAQMLLDRHREVAAAFDGGVVGDDHAGSPADRRDPAHDSRARSLAVVQVVGSQRRQLQKRRAGIDQLLDPLAHRQLAAGAVAIHGIGATADRARCEGRFEVGRECAIRSRLTVLVTVGVDARRDPGHRLGA